MYPSTLCTSPPSPSTCEHTHSALLTQRFRLAAEYGLQLRYNAGFHEFYEEHKQDRKYLRLLSRMRCLDERGHLEPENWEVSAIYMGFIFQKEGEPTRSQRPPIRHQEARGRPLVIDLISQELKAERD